MKKITVNLFALLAIFGGSLLLSTESAEAFYRVCEQGKYELECDDHNGTIYCCSVCSSTGEIGDCYQF